MKKKILAITTLVLGVFAISCSSDDGPPTSNLTLEIIGLQPLTSGATYEGWLVVEGETLSIGKFNDVSSSITIPVVAERLENATEFILSIEPPNDNDPEPSKTKLLSGLFSGNVAQVSVNTVMQDFSSISGKFIMATPTDNVADNDEFGIWFEDPSGIQAVPGLDLPMLVDGWKYEGWVIFNNIPVTTGTFSDVDTFDDASPFSGNVQSPGYPGEDFLNSAPQGLTFPQDGDVRGKTVVISVEPFPDYDQATPFFVKVLEGTAQQNVAPAINNLTATNTLPFGRVVR
ncbi:anti-sigma factor [Aquimarina gracilis]|uniref:Anti-sigma factor n=1 Tax=Aquimarina gracilis TaxID=874422 RepID=A0ABU5ZXI4_9FLAO|nr:anti-sigma factor [Aquimarina gracilis]MEB3346558.1 anti-sigma factor [Aquimarina gracilis]